MAKTYLNFLIQAMRKMLFVKTDQAKMNLLFLITFCRLLNCNSILDIAQTFELDKDQLYQSVDIVASGTWLRRIRRQGRERLLAALRRWWSRDASYRSRHAITICVDDFTRMAYGNLGGWAGLFYSGAEGGVVPGINVEALVAVIGDGEEVIILDIRVVPSNLGLGRNPMTKNDWFCQRLKLLNKWIKNKKSSFEGCFLSVDAGYVSEETVKLSGDLGLQMVSKLAENRVVFGEISKECESEFEAPAWFFSRLGLCLNPEKIHLLPGSNEVEYFRQVVWSEHLGQILMITFIDGDKHVTYFSTNPGMKAITLANTLRRRWQLERIFWILRQDLGVGDIHHQTRERVEARILLLVILAQATRDCSIKFKCSPKDIVRTIRRVNFIIPITLGIPCAFVREFPWGFASEESRAA